MVPWNEYIRGILEKIIQSHSILSELKDVPGDLNIIEKELLKIIGFFNVIIRKLDSENFQSKSLADLKSKLNEYLDNYYFEKEIEAISLLYSEDTNRLRNLRLKILESFEDKKLMDRIKNVIEDI